MQRLRTHQMKRRLGRLLITALLVLSNGLADDARGASTAETYDFSANGADLPISATTEFFEYESNPDLSNTAQHEIGHALGFTISYSLFNANVSVLGGGPNRQYKDKDDGTVLAHLGPAGGGTHMLVGVTVDGNNQTNDIMRPDQVVGQTWGGQDTKILQDAFDWQDYNITVDIIFGTAFTLAQRNTITAAAATVSSALGSSGTAHTFTWTVIPEPGTSSLLGAGLLGLVLRARKAGRS